MVRCSFRIVQHAQECQEERADQEAAIVTVDNKQQHQQQEQQQQQEEAEQELAKSVVNTAMVPRAVALAKAAAVPLPGSPATGVPVEPPARSRGNAQVC